MSLSRARHCCATSGWTWHGEENAISATGPRTRGGERLADKGIRRLRQEQRRALGAAPAVVYLDGCYGVFALEELLAVLGAPVRESVLPAPRGVPPPTAPSGPST